MQGKELTDLKVKDLEKITPIVDGLILMEGNRGWVWLKEKLEEAEKKYLDISLGDDNIDTSKVNLDKARGRVLQIKEIFNDIDHIKNQHKKLLEEK